jgi:hypothetical protein
MNRRISCAWSLGTWSCFKRDFTVLPLNPQTQHSNGFSPFSLVAMLISNLGFLWLHLGHVNA